MRTGPMIFGLNMAGVLVLLLAGRPVYALLWFAMMALAQAVYLAVRYSKRTEE